MPIAVMIGSFLGTRTLILREKQFLYSLANTENLRLSILWVPFRKSQNIKALRPVFTDQSMFDQSIKLDALELFSFITSERFPLTQ